MAWSSLKIFRIQFAWNGMKWKVKIYRQHTFEEEETDTNRAENVMQWSLISVSEREKENIFTQSERISTKTKRRNAEKAKKRAEKKCVNFWNRILTRSLGANHQLLIISFILLYECAQHRLNDKTYTNPNGMKTTWHKNKWFDSVECVT